MAGRWLLPALALSTALAGCVERTLTITSEPTGALVHISSVEVGRTPVRMPFTWYGDYDVVLRHEGCQTLKTHLRLDPPAYDVPPLDLLSAMAPWRYEVERSAHFTLQPREAPSDAELLRRADGLRSRAAFDQ